jgi:pre-mRNA-splicing helicase BRR2
VFLIVFFVCFCIAPSDYNLSGTSHRHFSDHLSELVENTLEDLSAAKMISQEESGELAPLNLGMVAAYYYIKYTTVEIFSRSLQKKTKLKGLLEILSSASEFDDLPVRPKEEEALRKLARHLPLIAASAESGGFDDAHTKTNVLLQTHFSRIPLSPSVGRDLAQLLPVASRLLQAMVDVLSSSGWLSPALACMELSQMITQGMWNNESVLLQLPHFTKDLVERCKASGVNSIADLMELEDSDRDKLLQFSPAQLQAVATVCNSYPDIDVSYTLPEKDDLHAGSKTTLEVKLLRDPDEEDPEELAGVPLVSSARYPGVKSEGWWIVLGNVGSNELVSIKRVAMSSREMKISLDFTPQTKGEVKYMVSDGGNAKIRWVSVLHILLWVLTFSLYLCVVPLPSALLHVSRLPWRRSGIRNYTRCEGSEGIRLRG